MTEVARSLIGLPRPRSGSSGARDSLAALGTEDLERLLWRVIAVLIVMVPLELLAGQILASDDLTYSAAAVGVFASMAAGVLVLLRRGQTAAAYVTFAVSVLGATAVVSRIVPNGPATGIAPLMVIAAALPFLTGRRLLAVMVVVWLFTSTIVAAQELLPPATGPSPEMEAVLRVAAFVLAGGLVLYLLNRFASILHLMRREADERLEASHAAQAAYAALVEGVPVGLFRATIAGRSINFVDANRALVQMLGYESLAELLATPLEELYEPVNDLPLVPPPPGGERRISEVVLRTRGGGHRVTRVTWSGSSDASGRPVEYRGVVEDITDQRAAERHAESTGRRMATFLENARVGMAVVDLDFRFVEVNPELCRILGYEASELLVMSHEDLLHPDDKGKDIATYRWAMEHPEESRPYVGERRLVRADGEVIWIRLVASLVWSEDHRPQFGVGTYEDITELKRSAEALDREIAERASIAAALRELKPSADPAVTAARICESILKLGGVDMASVLDMSNGHVVPIALVAPEAAPVRTGQAVPATRARWLRRRASAGPWFQIWTNSGTRYERAWYASGIRASAYVPITWEGRIVGMLFGGSSTVTTDADGARWLAGLEEFGALASALLGEALVRRRESIGARAAVLEAIATGGHRPVFQPIVRLSDRAVVGFEALTRFAAHDPQTLFERATSVGLAADLQAACLRDSVAASAALPAGWLSVNVSPSTVGVGVELGRTVRGRPLVVEVTEEEAVEDYATLREHLGAIPGNVQLAVDDAGAGFASLRHIIELRPHFVKLAMHIVRGVDTDPARQAMVAGMVHFAVSSGAEIIAEGIETEAELAILAELGVGLGQGYLLGRPAAAETFNPALSSAA